jgi:hypothetical protein
MKWTSIKDKMPELTSGQSGPLIVSNGKEVYDDCMYIHGSFWVHYGGYDNDSFEIDDVTHWMPLPEPPDAPPH